MVEVHNRDSSSKTKNLSMTALLDGIMVTEGICGTKLFCPKQPKKQEKHRVKMKIKYWKEHVSSNYIPKISVSIKQKVIKQSVISIQRPKKFKKMKTCVGVVHPSFKFVPNMTSNYKHTK